MYFSAKQNVFTGFCALTVAIPALSSHEIISYGKNVILFIPIALLVSYYFLLIFLYVGKEPNDMF